MSTVWAAHTGPRIGQWRDRAYTTGWSHTFHFSSLRDLLEQMSRRRGLRERPRTPAFRTMRPPTPDLRQHGQVTRLGIVAHGDTQGVVQLDRDLTVSSISSFDQKLQELCSYLTDNAQVIFYSCNMAFGRAGDALLNALSARLPGRTVIGFTIQGETDANEMLSAMSPQSPGRVREAPHGTGSGRPGREGLLGPWSLYAKWSRDGTIVRRPPVERGPSNRCANPSCGGHSSPRHHCSGFH